MDAFFYNTDSRTVFFWDRSTRKVWSDDEHRQLLSQGIPLEGADHNWELVISPAKNCPTPWEGWRTAMDSFFSLGRSVSPTMVRNPDGQLMGNALDPHGHLWEFYRDGQINAGCKSFKDYEDALEHYSDPDYDGTYYYDPTVPMKFMRIHLKALGVTMV